MSSDCQFGFCFRLVFVCTVSFTSQFNQCYNFDNITNYSLIVNSGMFFWISTIDVFGNVSNNRDWPIKLNWTESCP